MLLVFLQPSTKSKQARRQALMTNQVTSIRRARRDSQNFIFEFLLSHCFQHAGTKGTHWIVWQYILTDRSSFESRLPQDDFIGRDFASHARFQGRCPRSSWKRLGCVLGLLGLLGFFNSQGLLTEDKRMIPSFPADIVVDDKTFQDSKYVEMRWRSRRETYLIPRRP